MTDASRRLRWTAAMVMAGAHQGRPYATIIDAFVAGAHQGRPYALIIDDIVDRDVKTMQTLSIVEGDGFNA